MIITTSFKDKVLRDMKLLEAGGVVELTKANPNHQRFIAAVKVIIDWGEDTANDFTLMFNDNFTRLKKVVSLKEQPIWLTRNQ